jgi:hypothetical protein
MALPHDVQPEHIVKAIEEIERLGHESIPKRRRIKKNKPKYALRYNKIEYPPKYVICLAHKFVDGDEFENIFGGGDEANNFLIARKFHVWDLSKDPPAEVGIEPVSEDEEEAFLEGGIKGYRVHRHIERNKKVARAAKRKRLQKTGDLACDCCETSFLKVYGELGAGYIEAHHTMPISAMKKNHKTKLSEIALVCSNCHRILHRNWPLSVENLRQKIKEVRART